MPKSLEEGFAKFLEWLAPLASEHNTAKKHKDSVLSSLENSFKCTKIFETGSFGSGTGVRHKSDTDYFAVLPTAEVWSDSAYTLTKVKDALKRTFWQTEGIVVSSPSVKIPFGTYRSEDLEVIPCVFSGIMKTVHSSHAAYEIADGNSAWMLSSPAAHNAYVKYHDDRLGGKLRSLIQLVKAWKFYNNVPIYSFYLELRVTKYAETETSIVYDTDLVRIMRSLHSHQLAKIQDPMGISGYISACASEAKKDDALSKLSTGLTRAEKAYDYRSSDLDRAFEWWDKFFNNEFPAR